MTKIRCPFEDFVKLDPLERIELINKQRHEIKWEYADYDYTIKISDVVKNKRKNTNTPAIIRQVGKDMSINILCL